MPSGNEEEDTYICPVVMRRRILTHIYIMKRRNAAIARTRPAATEKLQV